jgi:membrane-bound ClpP family serine protease
MIFLPWWTVSYFGFSASSNGFLGGGILTFLMSLVGIGLSFIEISTPKYRAYGIMGVGVLALLGTLIAFAEYSGTSMGFGRIIALIISILIIVDGFMDYRGIDLWAKMKASSSKSPASAPPPPPPPPSSPPKPPPPPPAPPAQQ